MDKGRDMDRIGIMIWIRIWIMIGIGIRMCTTPVSFGGSVRGLVVPDVVW
jgi:hypothetical protein